MNAPKSCSLSVVGSTSLIAPRIQAMLNDERRRLDARWKHAHHANADLLIIDVDSVHGHMEWLKAQAAGKRVVALTSSERFRDQDYRLGSPFVADDLVDLLNRISAHNDDVADMQPISLESDQILVDLPDSDFPIIDIAQAVPSPDLPITTLPAANTCLEPAPVSSSPPKPARFRPALVESDASAPKAPAAQAVEAITPPAPVVMTLLDLISENPPMVGRLRLQADGLADLLLDSRAQAWHSPASLKGLSAWCTRELTTNEVKLVSEAEFADAAASMPAQRFLRLKWLTHLVRGNGQLDPALDPNGRYKLARWPQSEREFPKHFRIATMMLKTAAPIDEISELSGAPRADVVNFVNAYHAIDFIDAESVVQNQDENRRSSLFERAKRVALAS